MGEGKNEIVAEEGPDAEIELNVDDLVSLSAAADIERSESTVRIPAVMAVETRQLSQPLTSAKRTDVSDTRLANSGNAMFIGLVIASGVAGLAVYSHTQSKPSKALQQTWKPAFPQPIEAAAPEPPEPELQVVPVRYTNPFDASEVFEFPPGTSRAAAREAVAEMLLQRAAERENSARR
jgi:hypothetical protein